MKKKVCAGKLWLAVLLGVFLALPLTDAFAAWGWSKSRPSVHQDIVVRHQKYRYHEGRFYKPAFFGLWFILIRPPIGVIVTTLPFGHKTVVCAGVTYYCHDNVYYRSHPSGYIVVSAPDTHAARPQEYLTGQEITINIPNSRGSYTPVVLVKRGDGYVGPQGEYYSGHPKVEQLLALYGN